MSRYLGLASALGAIFALTSAATAGDDTVRLDMRKSSKVTLTGGTEGTSQFTHDARAKASDEEIEDVYYGYGRGYWRGYHGGGYIVPRFYPFRAGYRAGVYARGGFGYGYGFYPSYRFSSYYYPPVRYYYPTTYYYSSPTVAYVDPCGGSAATVADTNTLELQPRTQMPRPRMVEPAPSAPRTKPMEPVYPYDGPADAKQGSPSYRYDGGPSNPVPMPPDVNPSGSAPKADSAEGRIVKLAPVSKKPAYQAYGDNLRKTERTVVVKKTND